MMALVFIRMNEVGMVSLRQSSTMLPQTKKHLKEWLSNITTQSLWNTRLT